SGAYATIAGGADNVADGYEFATVGGGGQNRAAASYGTIAGGGQNSVGFDYATISGGSSNFAHAYYSVVGGGYNNSIRSDSFSFLFGSSPLSTIGGGENNSIVPRLDFGTLSYVDSDHGAIAGGSGNLIVGASCATIPGGRDNYVGGAFAL